MKSRNKKILLQMTMSAAMMVCLSGCSYSGNQTGYGWLPSAVLKILYLCTYKKIPPELAVFFY
nr:hypothetical protein [uncultured Clostridium sp.]